MGWGPVELIFPGEAIDPGPTRSPPDPDAAPAETPRARAGRHAPARTSSRRATRCSRSRAPRRHGRPSWTPPTASADRPSSSPARCSSIPAEVVPSPGERRSSPTRCAPTPAHHRRRTRARRARPGHRDRARHGGAGVEPCGTSTTATSTRSGSSSSDRARAGAPPRRSSTRSAPLRRSTGAPPTRTGAHARAARHPRLAGDVGHRGRAGGAALGASRSLCEVGGVGVRLAVGARLIRRGRRLVTGSRRRCDPALGV